MLETEIKMKPAVLVALTGSLFFATSALAQSRLDDAIGQSRAESFKVFDLDGNGTADIKEVLAGTKSVFTALDADGNGSASLDEFQVFSMGYEPLAETNTQKTAYDTARGTIFTRWDTNADQQLTESEVTTAVLVELLTAANANLTGQQYGSAAFIAEMEASLKQ
jgi:hypothetical protein